ncbi:MAG: sensor domain-containing diguanylate cyclase [Spirochaetae bacterium HGW-Spirochaetae-1]|jgi:diguanylate cyclase (GGDEF)-like protein|nr:MAG: sensor domain-containing diguanylate cyclase [Spirochaetae bacterium HGW-Spirochaetae-1]
MDMEITWPIEIEQYERKIYDLKQLIEISKGLNSTLDYNTLIESILLTCMGQMQLLKAGIFLKRGIGSDNFVLHRNYKGFEIDHSQEYEFSYEDSMTGLMESFSRCYTMPELKIHGFQSSALEVLHRLDPSLVVPLVGKGHMNGIIILGERINQGGFSEVEKEYLLNIASLASIAIHNASLYEMATTDMMTKLKIHHYFHSAMEEEFERTVRFNRPLSLIMADIDHFKQFNDTYGHSAGDHVLKVVANLLKENIRPMDIAARYGGEEFAIILPKTDMTEALIVAERIRQNISTEIIRYEDKHLNVTISVGLTQMDIDSDKSKKDVITRADKALYMSKNSGRNTVSFM